MKLTVLKTLLNILNKEKVAGISSFILGIFLGAIPYAYESIENYKIDKLVKKENLLQIKKKENECKDDNSDYAKFLNLGFPKTALKKFNICMQRNF